MSTVSLQDINLPCWIFDKDLRKEYGSNTAARSFGNITTYLDDERAMLLSGLANEGIVCFGKPRNFIAYTTGDRVFVQCLSDLIIDYSKENKLSAGDIEKERLTHQQTQEKLRQNNAKLEAIFDSTALYIWTMRSDGTLTSFNRRFKEQMSEWFERDMVLGSSLVAEPYEENVSQWNHFQDKLKACLRGAKSTVQLKLLTDDGEYVWVEIYMDPIKDQDTKEAHEVSCIGFEISEKKKKNDLISQSLKEKETLLKEVHHRVKNNLQIISSLLSLQSSVIKDEQVIDILKESQNRVRSMSYIHESLYGNTDFNAVNLKDYVVGLCGNLSQSYSLTSGNVSVDTEVEEITLEMDQAIPCGLILNELISNSLKHAFPKEERGLVKVQIREKNGRIAILVEDDGTGIPSEWNIDEAESLGIQLVYSLTEQLDGDIEVSSVKGTKYLITFERIKTSRKKWQEPRS